jgi:hypothetical protein
MTLDVEPIPESFLGKLLGAYGLQWTHLVIISGVAFSSFGLERYLNPGIWILTTVAAFGVVFLFRAQIERRVTFPVAAAAGLVLVGAGFGGLVLAADPTRHQSLGTFMEVHSTVATLYLGLLVGIPVGIAILSFRSQETFRYAPLTPKLALALNETVAHAPFALDTAMYVIDLQLEHSTTSGGLSTHSGSGSPQRILFHYTVNMAVVNRLAERVTYTDVFDPAGDDKSFVYATLKGKKVQMNPERLSGRGLHLTYEAEPSERFEVFVEGQSTFHVRDSELVGTYLPCEHLRIMIRRPPDGIAVQVQSLTPKPTDVEELPNGDLMWEHAQGILPFQGARVFWEPAQPVRP